MSNGNNLVLKVLSSIFLAVVSQSALGETPTTGTQPEKDGVPILEFVDGTKTQLQSVAYSYPHAAHYGVLMRALIPARLKIDITESSADTIVVSATESHHRTMYRIARRMAEHKLFTVDAGNSEPEAIVDAEKMNRAMTEIRKKTADARTRLLEGASLFALDLGPTKPKALKEPVSGKLTVQQYESIEEDVVQLGVKAFRRMIENVEIAGWEDTAKLNQLAINAYDSLNVRNAESCWLKALQAEPRSVTVLHNLMIVMNRLDKAQEAQKLKQTLEAWYPGPQVYAPFELQDWRITYPADQKLAIAQAAATLTAQVTQEFERKQDQQTAQLARLREKLKQIETRIHYREKNRDAIINHRVEFLQKHPEALMDTVRQTLESNLSTATSELGIDDKLEATSNLQIGSSVSQRLRTKLKLAEVDYKAAARIAEFAQVTLARQGKLRESGSFSPSEYSKSEAETAQAKFAAQRAYVLYQSAREELSGFRKLLEKRLRETEASIKQLNRHRKGNNASLDNSDDVLSLLENELERAEAARDEIKAAIDVLNN